MGQLSEIEMLRMKKREKEVQAKRLKEKLHVLEEDIKAFDERILTIKNREVSGGFSSSFM